MIESMITLRITEAELARDVRTVLNKVEQGSEVIIEREDHQPVALIQSPNRSGRPIEDILREARQRNLTVTLDEDFGKDLEEVIGAPPATMEPALLGLVLDSSAVIAAERNKHAVPELIA